MKIGIDVRPLLSSTKNRGIGYYTANVLAEIIAQKDTNYQFVLYKTKTGNLSDKLKLRESDRFYGIPTLFHPRRGIRRFDPILSPFWSRALKVTQPDLLHLTSFFEVYYLSLPSHVKTVVTLHDLIPILFEKWCFDNELAKQWYWSRLEQIKRCSKIITISSSAKKDIIKILEVPEEKVVVVYGGLDKRFQMMEKDKVKRILVKHGIHNPYFLSVGAPSRHKNVSRIFEAFKNYIKVSKNGSLKLVVVCKLLPFEREIWQKEIKKIGIAEKVILTNFVSDQEMPAFYNGAEMLLFPSLYEGFGLPILEAMACGIPVITSNVSSMPEVGGEAAFYVNPESVEGIARAVSEIMGNRGRREEMVKKGLEQVKKFTWEKAAKQTLEVYRQVLSKH